MNRLLFLLIIFTLFQSCKDKAIDPTKTVRPVSLRISLDGSEFKLTWEPILYICITSPCPGDSDLEAEEYEVQIATEELGTFKTYRKLSADKKSISIPVAGKGEQLVARIVSKAKGAPPMNSVPVMITNGFVSQSSYYPGFGTSGDLEGGAVTQDGNRAVYYGLSGSGPGQNTILLYVAEMQNERMVSTKPVGRIGGRAKFSADGQQLAYPSSTEKGIIVYDIASEQSRTLPIVDSAAIQGIDWSPDGKWLAFSTFSNEASRLWKIAVAGGSAIPLTPPMPLSDLNYVRQADIDWSPDGQFIAVSRMLNTNNSKEARAVVSLYSPQGSGEVRYFETQPGWVDTTPTFSPDGKELAFLSTRTNSYSLWIRNLATGKVRRVELLPGLILSPDYQPSWLGNERLLFMGSQQGRKNYYTVFL